MKFYGSLNNRLEENKMFCEKIEVGTGMTEYSYSDTKAYEVVKVVNQNHVFVREYDHKHVGNTNMDNQWELVSNPNNPVKELKKRYGYWNWVSHWTKDTLEKCILLPEKNVIEKINKTGKAEVYSRTNVSFGVAQYYYDYEF